MKADFHVHTNNTDCSDTPEQVFQLAKENGVELLAITEHDTLIGREEYSTLAKQYQLTYVPGVEVSAYDYGRKRPCHIVGLYVETGCRILETMIDHVSKARQANSEQQINILAELGYNVSIGDLIDLRKGKAIYKQHIMEVLINKGYADDYYGDFYNKMFKNNGPLQMQIDYPSHIDAVKALKKAGAIPVLAHPTLYGNLEAVMELCQAGLEAIEVNYPGVTHKEQLLIQEIARDNQLRLSGGSDYHGRYAGHSTGTVGSHWIDWTD